MTSEEAVNAIKGKCIEACGLTEGIALGGRIAPNIVADFEKTAAAAEGQEVSETYKLEDGSLEIVLRGARHEGGRMEITSVERVM